MVGVLVLIAKNLIVEEEDFGEQGELRALYCLLIVNSPGGCAPFCRLIGLSPSRYFSEGTPNAPLKGTSRIAAPA
jgi:hypothetical protein